MAIEKILWAILLGLIITVSAVSCGKNSSAEEIKYSKTVTGNVYDIICYSGGKQIYTGSGRVAAAGQNRVELIDEKTGKFTVVMGDCVMASK